MTATQAFPPPVAPLASAGASPGEPTLPAPNVSFTGRSWWLVTPSWLVSCVLHLALMIGLALFTVSALLPEPAVIVTVSLSEPETPFEEFVEFESAPGPLEVATPVALPLPDLGPAPPWSEPSFSAAAPPLEFSGAGSLAEIGVLFGGTGRGMAATSVSLGGAEFFGVKAAGKRFVFVVDSSNSMRGGKFDDAKRELLLAAKRLKKDQFFYVMFFDANVERMFNKENPAPRPLPATEENLRKLEYWLPTVQNELKTRPHEAMQLALEMMPDAIYLLTDGKIQDDTEAYLQRANRTTEPVYGPRAKVAVHTVGFWTTSGQDVLKRMARENGGTYRYVPPPGVRAAMQR